MQDNKNLIQPTAGMYSAQDVIFKKMLDLFMLDYYFCLPCVVEVVHVDTQTVDIRPVLKAYSSATGNSATRPLITNVPFWMYRGGDTYMTLPIKPGDTGLAIFSQKDISNWKETGGEVALQSLRIHDYNDALFLPYVGPKVKAVANYNPDNITIVKNGKVIEVKDGTLHAPDYDFVCKNIQCTTVHSTGTVTSDTDCISGGISGKTHVHGGVSSGPYDTGVPK